jgi:hypothetical protein
MSEEIQQTRVNFNCGGVELGNLAVMSGTHSGTLPGRGGRFVASFLSREEDGHGARGENDEQASPPTR